MTGETGRGLAWALFAVWAGIYAWSFAIFLVTVPAGDGFVRGLNKVTAFFGWQIAAGVLALVLLWAKRWFAPGSVPRRLCWAPAGLLGLLALAAVAVIAAANYGHPAPIAPRSGPATAPAETPN